MKKIWVTIKVDEKDASGRELPVREYTSTQDAWAAVERSRLAEKEWHEGTSRATAGLVRPTDIYDFEFEQDENHPYRGECDFWYHSKEAAEWAIALYNWTTSDEAESISKRWTGETAVVEVEVAE